MKRMPVITDSLGCPRTETSVENTWTDKLLKYLNDKPDLIIYTYCVHGLHAGIIPIDYIHEIKPDILIAQVGIVDACRRALKPIEIMIAQKFRIGGS